MDGSVDTDAGLVGVGGVLRESSRRWMSGYSNRVGRANSPLAECWALREGLLLAKQMGIRFLQIELAAKVLFDLVWNTSMENLLLRPLILKCRNLCREFNGVRGIHVQSGSGLHGES